MLSRKFGGGWPDFEGPARVTPAGSQRAGFLVRDNLWHRDDIEDEYLAASGRALEVLIANSYFFPGLAFRRALVDAAARGVRVILLLQGRVEYRLLHYATRALYGALLEAGVEIQEYHKSFLHAKVAVIDQRWATVGSSNIDPFSLLLAREANVVVDDAAFSGVLVRVCRARSRRRATMRPSIGADGRGLRDVAHGVVCLPAC